MVQQDTAQQDTGEGASRHHGPEHTPRLRLKRKAPVAGYVDGAWWPHGDDLPTELQDLVKVLSVRLGDVARVTYNMAEWAKPPRKIRIDDQIVRLDGYHRQPTHTVGILDGRGGQIVLLVVPVQTGADDAHAIMMAAAAPEDASDVESLLAGGTPDELATN